MEPQYVNVAAFMAKYRSKRECFTFCKSKNLLIMFLVSIDGEAYLPPFDTVTVYFCKFMNFLTIAVKDII